MLAAYASAISPDDPLSGLKVEQTADPEVPDGWELVTVRAAALNHHDLWSLKGVGLSADLLPMILGCDAAGVAADGTEVVVHAVIGDPAAGGGDETMDPKRSLLSEKYPGTLAEQVAVPKRNLVPKPAGLSFEEAACLPTAYLTAYRMLVTRSGLTGPGSVLVQGAGGGVATALLLLGKALGHTVFVTSRDEGKRAKAESLGADGVFEPGARLPVRVDAVMETVGRGDLVALAEVAAARRHPRRLRCDQRAEPAGRPQPRLLPSAFRRRFDDGNARRARRPAEAAGRDRRAPADRRRAPAGRRPRRRSPRLPAATCSASSS